MKLITVLFFLAAMVLGFANASDYMKCHHVDSQIPHAIHKLCNRPKLKVPGARTSHGSRYGNIRVKIGGDCHPKKHVGSQMCLNRFFKQCAEQGDVFKNGGVSRVDIGCEHYEILRLNRPRHKHHKGPLIKHPNKGG